MLTVLGSIFGEKICVLLYKLLLISHYTRANRAQYSEVSFQGVSDDDVSAVNLPSMQGAEEDDGG